ncbi:hypothetical protein VaNZ11_002487 [Volvox africanus]|uniref:TF-B3 domain-containing protein n=1 Tax=Volvox africanus TaxID=51714 RepID=A0ABQ5RRZ6_9CHLO|nr:hypothetical protein VaNZ11_002487 [Volvox africanus]
MSCPRNGRAQCFRRPISGAGSGAAGHDIKFTETYMVNQLQTFISICFSGPPTHIGAHVSLTLGVAKPAGDAKSVNITSRCQRIWVRRATTMGRKRKKRRRRRRRKKRRRRRRRRRRGRGDSSNRPRTTKTKRTLRNLAPTYLRTAVSPQPRRRCIPHSLDRAWHLCSWGGHNRRGVTLQERTGPSNGGDANINTSSSRFPRFVNNCCTRCSLCTRYTRSSNATYCNQLQHELMKNSCSERRQPARPRHAPATVTSKAIVGGPTPPQQQKQPHGRAERHMQRDPVKGAARQMRSAHLFPADTKIEVQPYAGEEASRGQHQKQQQQNWDNMDPTWVVSCPLDLATGAATRHPGSQQGQHGRHRLGAHEPQQQQQQQQPMSVEPGNAQRRRGGMEGDGKPALVRPTSSSGGSGAIIAAGGPGATIVSKTDGRWRSTRAATGASAPAAGNAHGVRPNSSARSGPLPVVHKISEMATEALVAKLAPVPVPAPTPMPVPVPVPTPVPVPVPAPTPVPVPAPGPTPIPVPVPVPTPVPVSAPAPTPVPGPGPGPVPIPSSPPRRSPRRSSRRCKKDPAGAQAERILVEQQRSIRGMSCSADAAGGATKGVEGSDRWQVLFAKALTASDTRTRRVIVPRSVLESSFPQAAKQSRFSLFFNATDATGVCWYFAIGFWKVGKCQSPVYVMERMFGFMKRYDLITGDVVGVLRAPDGTMYVEVNTSAVIAAAAPAVTGRAKPSADALCLAQPSHPQTALVQSPENPEVEDERSRGRGEYAHELAQ